MIQRSRATRALKAISTFVLLCFCTNEFMDLQNNRKEEHKQTCIFVGTTLIHHFTDGDKKT